METMLAWKPSAGLPPGVRGTPTRVFHASMRRAGVADAADSYTTAGWANHSPGARRMSRSIRLKSTVPGLCVTLLNGGVHQRVRLSRGASLRGRFASIAPFSILARREPPGKTDRRTAA